ncbi:hypothetical protein Acr_00g0067370 [Actinidia rufa]|uniref:Uncharacterized protein n=1 Tax=Actinidia rufa TaxID=165716 RepID=A0A7J0DQM7_9ERIC|nr:hypothetical protein Acr_00g0067370 [Actinidia rufa]
MAGVIPAAAPSVRAMISPLILALIAELTTTKIWSFPAPISSAISIQWDATRAAADATEPDDLEDAFCRVVDFSGDVTDEAARAATAAATPVTDTACMQLGIVGSVLLLLPFLLIFPPSPHCPSPHDPPIQLKNNIDDLYNDGDDRKVKVACGSWICEGICGGKGNDNGKDQKIRL